jgi:hypothetical protein
MATTAELLNAVNTAIANRLAGVTAEEWTEGAIRYKDTPTAELRLLRKQLQRELASESGGNLRLGAFRRR